MDRRPRYLKPGWLTSRVLNPLFMRLGTIPTLAVRGRTSGEWRTVPVNVLELDGQRYLVAPRGDTQWVRNLRATGRGELRLRGRVEPFRATEIPDNEKPRVIEAYLARWAIRSRAISRRCRIGPTTQCSGSSGCRALIRNGRRNRRSREPRLGSRG
jgi:deazaflavin-dependent oxidoreductase (nitroreductase family)